MLNDTEIQKLRTLMQMDGWREVMKPLIANRMKTCQRLAFLMPSERPEPYSKLDDSTATSILRGEAKNCEWILAAFENEIAVFDMNRRREELAHGETQPEPRPANPI